jgi:glycosyltransferase involved in cell wall biosynthesis
VKIAIIGTRGIPNYYGGFEQFAEYFSVFLANRGHDVHVYCPRNHKYRENEYQGVKLVKCYDPESHLGTMGQFIYDLNCILHSRKLNPDVILNLGYTSSAIFMPLFKKKVPVITNMDGLEWKRSKYNKLIQKFIKISERLAVKYSNTLVSDSPGIQSYIMNTYTRRSVYIPYGADVPDYIPSVELLPEFDVKPYQYNIILARMEPENNIEVILDGVVQARTAQKTIVIGNYANRFGNYLHQKFKANEKIIFLGSFYNIGKLNALRYYCNVYFHGHSVGGTNPSLLEAMASSALICAHNNEFNRNVLGGNALYFTSSRDISDRLESGLSDSLRKQYILNNISNIKELYNWESINLQYESTLVNAVSSKK